METFSMVQKIFSILKATIFLILTKSVAFPKNQPSDMNVLSFIKKEKYLLFRFTSNIKKQN